MHADNRPFVIAIDGPAASGKSTIGFRLARRLGYLYLDTGSMYRAVALAALSKGIAPDDEAGLQRLAEKIDLVVQPVGDADDGRQYTVLLDGNDVTWELRRPEVDRTVSQVSLYPGVRAAMVRRQRAVARSLPTVMVGRDIGTVVMPDADLKLYITATPEERARRRLLDRQQQGLPGDYETILADVLRRDAIDSGRKHSPLRRADDAVEIDTTGLTVDEVIDRILSMVSNKETV